jgi:hypothetical protein
MTRRTYRTYAILALSGFTALAAGCGDDDDSGGPSGGDSGEAGGGGEPDADSGGKSSTSGSGGARTGGTSGSKGGATAQGGEDTGSGGEAVQGGDTGSGGMGASGAPAQGGEDTGSGGETATGGDGGTGNVPTTAGIDDVVLSICEWEFRCCDEGEINYRLSPFSTDAATCAERLIFEMRESNVTSNPYVSGPAAMGGLLGTLGYVVDLDRVDIDMAGAAECVGFWNNLDCNEPASEQVARCSGPAEPDPCALTNIFTPKLQIGEECTEALAPPEDVSATAPRRATSATRARSTIRTFPWSVRRMLSAGTGFRATPWISNASKAARSTTAARAISSVRTTPVARLSRSPSRKPSSRSAPSSARTPRRSATRTRIASTRCTATRPSATVSPI